ncbi:hypothetical protein AGDE_15626 [Angomonas deanei]|uniref:Uncharacterized protein n=1 Tax=Angomonas deanei TaxID=59799 RepID=A0A7G2CKW8_9TRYP|nr:hypothetical protein AGDE_15626 [Angomonas deanei]CAD2219564.1 hypothetical protein, conserved [Angomonas deanei]|eukprot:EPY18739.1 hypothetical protein AGDE_15626 [Angomonas deanei]
MQKANDPEDDAALVTLLKSISSLAEGEDNCLSSVGTSTNEAEGPHINSKANLSSSNPKIDQLLRDLGKSFHGISVNEEDVKKLVSHESKATPRDEEGWSPVKLDDL